MQYCRKIANFFARSDMFFYVLIWLIILLLIGTVAQKFYGLYYTQHKFFSSFYFTIFGILPLPGGYSVVAYILVSLFCKLALEKWQLKNTGSIITHLGVALLLIGCSFSGLLSQEGSMVLKAGESSNVMVDYHDTEMVIYEAGNDDKPAVIWGQKLLKQDNPLTSNNLPFTVKPLDFFSNVNITKRDINEDNGQMQGMAKAIKLSQAPDELDGEKNLSGLNFAIIDKNGKNIGIYSIFTDMPIKQYITYGEKKYLSVLRKKNTQLPFQISLNKFDYAYHPGTQKAKYYLSEVILNDGKLTWNATITMNEPLQYKEYSIFQASFFIDGNDKYTVLAVVKNIGRNFPYIAGAVISIGLILHILIRLFIKNGSKNADT